MQIMILVLERSIQRHAKNEKGGRAHLCLGVLVHLGVADQQASSQKGCTVTC